MSSPSVILSSVGVKEMALQPAMDHEQLIDHFRDVPSLMADYAAHGSSPEWRNYINLVNVGRSNRSVWRVFLERTEEAPNKLALAWVDSNGNTVTSWSYKQFLDRIRTLCDYISRLAPSPAPGSRILLCYSPGLEFYVAFWSCLALGLLPVPVCPMDPFNPANDLTAKLSSIISVTQPALVLMNLEYYNLIEAAKQYRGPEQWAASPLAPYELLVTDDTIIRSKFSPSASYAFPTSDALHPKDGLSLCFLQFTSGSTGDAKGVMVANVNVLHNAAACMELTRAGKSLSHFLHCVGLSWCPHFHDMQLIGFHLAPLLYGGSCVYFSPLDFLADPLLWPRLLTRWARGSGPHRHVMTGAPTFALELCAKRWSALSDDKQRAQSLDLSGVLSLIVGAEPLRLAAFTAFTSAFAPVGFDPCAFMPAYGLAESVLCVAAKKDNTYPPTCLFVAASELQQGRLVEIEAKDGADGQWLVASGEFMCPDRDYWEGLAHDTAVFIVDPLTGHERPHGEVGEIWTYSGSTCPGYYNNQEATHATFLGHLKRVREPADERYFKVAFLRTGDLGAVHGGALYVTGRLKELIIINGKNYYPHDLEQTIKQANLHVKKAAAVQVRLGDRGETVAVAMELNSKADVDPDREPQHGAAPGNAVAQRLFGLANLLPPTTRGPAIKVMARTARFIEEHKAQTKTDKAENETASNTDTGADPADAASSPSSADRGQFLDYSPADFAAIVRSIESALFRHHMLRVGPIVMFRPRGLPKTSSGKIRRKTIERIIVGDDHHYDGLIVYARGVQEKKGKKGAQAAATAGKAKAGKDDRDREEKRQIDTQPAAAVASLSAARGASSPSSASPLPPPADAAPMALADVRARCAAILSEELSIPVEALLDMSREFRLPAPSAAGCEAADPLAEAADALSAVGVDSIMAMKAAARISREFQLAVPLSPFMIINEPTLDGLCKIVQTLKAQGENIQLGPEPTQAPTPAAAAPAQAAAPPSASSSPSPASSSLPAGPPANPFIFGFGQCWPGSGAPQQALLSTMATALELPPPTAALFHRIGLASAIDRRHSVHESINAIYFGRRGVGNDEGIEARNAIYKREAPKLATQAAKAALGQWGGPPSSITHVVSVSCTGILVPGIEFHLVQSLGLPVHCQRLSINFMGCFGGISGLKAARAIACESPQHRVLVVCVELCSLHMQLNTSMDNLIGSSLFADGCGAAIVGAQPRLGERGLLEMFPSCSLIIPDTLSSMAWELSNTGMIIGLGKTIPHHIYEHIVDFARLLVRDTPIQGANAGRLHWAVHPGGPMIIDAICTRLGLPRERVQSAWETLRKYGNCSSATILFVLQHILKHEAGQEESKQYGPEWDWVPCVAFGPGLNVEGILLKIVRDDNGRANAEKEQQDEE